MSAGRAQSQMAEKCCLTLGFPVLLSCGQDNKVSAFSTLAVRWEGADIYVQYTGKGIAENPEKGAEIFGKVSIW